MEALDVISKDKKTVKWNGFPEMQAAHHFTVQREAIKSKQIEQKQQKLRALLSQFVAFRQLINRNKDRDGAAPSGMLESAATASTAVEAATTPCAPPAAIDGNASGAGTEADGADVDPECASTDEPDIQFDDQGLSAAELRAKRIQMPFLLVKTQTPSVIDCAMSETRDIATFSFQHPFSVHDDSDVLRSIGLHVLKPNADLQSLGVPPDLVAYVKGDGARSIRLRGQAPSVPRHAAKASQHDDHAQSIQ